MKVRLKSKKTLIIFCAIVAVAIGGFALWKFVLSDSSSTGGQTIIEEPREIKTDDVLVYISSDEDISEFASYMTGLDVQPKIDEIAATLQPNTPVKLLVFAPENEAFESDEAGKLANVPADKIDEMRLYYYATFTPTADGAEPNLELSDGKRLVMLNGRELFVSENSNGQFVITDAKGREATVSSRFVVDANGSRIYFIDNILLLQ